jgi:CheY-like chemotaxis protein
MPVSAPRPRVLLVDDHRPVLDTVARILAAGFEVVGTATDGYQAVEAARRTVPDVIVLDVEMPGLDGFQTLRALEDGGLAATPVVFLSTHAANDIIAEAFGCGGRGYVLKARLGRDLPGAIGQVLAGRRFVPSLTSLFDLADGSVHALQLHRGTESSLDALAAFFDAALRHGDATCVIATEPVRQGLGQRLRARGWQVAGPRAHERYQVVDAGDALRRFMRDGLPDAGVLAEIAAELDEYRRAVTTGPRSRLTIFGNMAAQLSAEGNPAATIALESLWNMLTHDRPFLTLCGYAASCFPAGAPNVWEDACAEHWAVSHASDV